MITRSKVSRLEEKFARMDRKQNGGIVVRDITEDGRLLDSNDYVMSEKEVELVKKEDKEMSERGKVIVCLLSYSEPKLKPDSATKPYHVDPYRGEAIRNTY
jgi:hypothetical protein